METEFRVTENRWIHHFLHYKSMGKNQCSKANNSKMNNPILPKFELVQAFMPVLVTCKFEKYQRWLRKARDIIFFTTQWHVTPKWQVRSSRNSNPSNTSCLSLLPVSLMKIEFRVTDKKWRQYCHHYKSYGKKIRAQGRITPKWIIRSNPNSNSFKLLCLSSLFANLTKIQSRVTEKSWRHHFFTAQGHVTPKWPVRWDTTEIRTQPRFYAYPRYRSFCWYSLTSEEDISLDSGITSAEGG